MNIFVVTPEGRWYTRPDSSLEREVKDFWLPDGFDSVRAVPCRHVRIIKAGKAVNIKFADRYFDSCGSGMVLYCEPGSFPYADSSTVLFPDSEAAGTLSPEETVRIKNAICDISRLASIRIGDLIVIEAADCRSLRRGDSAGRISVL